MVMETDQMDAAFGPRRRPRKDNVKNDKVQETSL